MFWSHINLYYPCFSKIYTFMGIFYLPVITKFGQIIVKFMPSIFNLFLVLLWRKSLWPMWSKFWRKLENAYSYTVGIYMFKVNNRYIRTRCEICSKLTIKRPEQRQICSKLTMKTPERRHWRRSNVFIVNFNIFGVVVFFIANFEHISHFVLVFILLTLGR